MMMEEKNFRSLLPAQRVSWFLTPNFLMSVFCHCLCLILFRWNKSNQQIWHSEDRSSAIWSLQICESKGTGLVWKRVILSRLLVLNTDLCLNTLLYKHVFQMLLAGQSPDVALEIFQKSLSFWKYQVLFMMLFLSLCTQLLLKKPFMFCQPSALYVIMCWCHRYSKRWHFRVI